MGSSRDIGWLIWTFVFLSMVGGLFSCDQSTDPVDEISSGDEKTTQDQSESEEDEAPTFAKALKDPSLATLTAPDEFKVKLTTTKGDVILKIHRAWAPIGADRFFNLVKMGYFTDIACFRNMPGFMVQFGIHGDPKIARKWRGAKITDDPVVESNTRGRITFANSGRDTRTVQVFINKRDNSALDRKKFSPFGEVIEGMDIVDSLFETGENPMDVQYNFQTRGNEYITEAYPEVDFVKSAEILEGTPE